MHLAPSLSILTCRVAPVAMLLPGRCGQCQLALPWALKAALWCLGFRGLQGSRLKEAWRQVLPVPLLAYLQDRKLTPVGTSDVLAPMA